MRLDVLLHDTIVGTLALYRGSNTTFRFEPSYLAMADRPVLGRWFEDHLDEQWEYSNPQSRLPPFFQNYLPEEGSALRTLIARRAGVKPHRELELLSVLGEDLPGAIVVRSDDETNGAESGDEHSVDAAVDDGAPLRFSLAGIQLKFSVLRNDDRFTLPASGKGGHWIVKLPDNRFPFVPLNEHAMLTWAKACGIDVPEFALTSVADIKGLPPELSFRELHALAIRRYDRTPTGRIHQEDFAQVLDVPPAEKYERWSYNNLARVIRAVCGDEDAAEFIRRLVFVLLSGNSDAHLKNWSLVYPDGRRARLSPAYDFVCTVAYPGTDPKFALNLNRTKYYTDVTTNDFQRLAAKSGMDPENVRVLVESFAATIRDQFRALRDELGLMKETLDTLDRHLSKMKL
ncbi:type II toxin-antitoxin system HipA family toxin [Polyangium sorediatum]|uniref:HipA domain-containing protein n=1 Tax=Polyangium sorediatum TaxID=889274 RepID=A0ABT6P6S5_9BACT|nr:HipA domain-containing protein [Polyangium sorediatum]MDI1436330.1 HipA domain-containing protein [Polyangium sorediatum]